MTETIGQFIERYNSQNSESMLVLVQGNYGPHVTGKLSREASKVKGEDEGYTAHRVRSVGDGFWIWKIIFTPGINPS